MKMQNLKETMGADFLAIRALNIFKIDSIKIDLLSYTFNVNLKKEANYILRTSLCLMQFENSVS